ncbi:MAG TPA: peptidylprolyl isomerase [Candidatus Acidoferrales bacterium]|nr:peptidylprolyl isomerase [Candidatus Acidoferrales bacterium]
MIRTQIRRALTHAVVVTFASAAFPFVAAGQALPIANREMLLNPRARAWNQRAPELFRVRLDTSRGPVVIEVHRDWAPHGADRFYNLVRFGYYDDSRFFRVVKGKWAQFGINGDPAISAVWRAQTIHDDPWRIPNAIGTVAFAFAVPNGRSTEVFINLRNNSKTNDAEGFEPFGRVVSGLNVALALNSEYGETSGGGIRAGHQDQLFAEGNRYLDREFPRLDRIRRAVIVQ